MGERTQAPSTVHGPTTVKGGGDGEGGDGGGGGEGDGGEGLGGGGISGGAACAQTSHPGLVTLPSEDHVKEALPRSTLTGPIVPLYVAPFTISLSWRFSVLKAVALKS